MADEENRVIIEAHINRVRVIKTSQERSNYLKRRGARIFDKVLEDH